MVFSADIRLVSVDEQTEREKVAYAVQELPKAFPAK
jgi:hypothetical protein